MTDAVVREVKPPCPYCGELLPTSRAKQCFLCGYDWHDPNNVVQRSNPGWTNRPSIDPDLQWPEVTPEKQELWRRIDVIGDSLDAGCTEEAFLKMRCPQCDKALELCVNPRGAGDYVVACSVDTSHIHMHRVNKSPPDWFQRYHKNVFY